MVKRGVAALVTDGVVRDLIGVKGTGLPVWSAGVAAPPSVASLTFVGWQQPIGCGGVAVMPDDIIVVDGDGAVLIPQALLDHVLGEAPEQERMENWIMGEVEKGVPLPGLYPMNEETKARYTKDRTLPRKSLEGVRQSRGLKRRHSGDWCCPSRDPQCDIDLGRFAFLEFAN